MKRKPALWATYKSPLIWWVPKGADPSTAVERSMRVYPDLRGVPCSDGDLCLTHRENIEAHPDRFELADGPPIEVEAHGVEWFVASAPKPKPKAKAKATRKR